MTAPIPSVVVDGRQKKVKLMADIPVMLDDDTGNKRDKRYIFSLRCAKQIATGGYTEIMSINMTHFPGRSR